MTGNTDLDILLIIILIAATILHVHLFKKKDYNLYIYNEGTQKFKKITTYKERSMRNAILEHFLSYGGNATLSQFKPDRDYNDYNMYYSLTVDGDTYNFAMIKEVNDVTNG